ncbi:MAG: hypothetical protein J6V71_00710 [Clostridia bacterium]|nr:hypothetical protein [Clostridia bacterium]
MVKALLAYQIQDAKLKEIEKTLAGSEERKKMSSAKKYILGVEENVNKLDDRALELKGIYAKTAEEQKKLQEQQIELAEAISSVNDEKEASFLIKKADELIAKIKALNSQASKIAEEIKSIVAEYDKIKSTTRVAQAQYKENADKYKELENSLKAEKESAEKELEALKNDVDASLMERYLKKRADKMYPIIYAVKGNSCGACRMELSMADINKLKNGEIIDCEQCGRMIYLEK